MTTENMTVYTYCFDCTGYKAETSRCQLTGEDVCSDCQVDYCVKNGDSSSVECNYCGKGL